MEKSRSHAALDSWLVQAEAVLQGNDEPETCHDCKDEPVENGDAA